MDTGPGHDRTSPPDIHMNSKLKDWKPKERFTDRATDYAAHRPGYPPAFLEFLTAELGLAHGAAAADIGSGTGILSELMLDAGYGVVGVEPNDKMREEAERRLGGRPAYTSVRGSAEATTLADRSVDFIMAAQSFHWFEPEATRTEWRRILRPGGWVVVCWNNRRTDHSEFDAGYEANLQTLGEPYRKIKDMWRDSPALVSSFFPGGSHGPRRFPHVQSHTWEGLLGRLKSASYVPPEGTPEFERLRESLRKLFDAHQREGIVELAYGTDVFWGRF